MKDCEKIRIFSSEIDMLTQWRSLCKEVSIVNMPNAMLCKISNERALRGESSDVLFVIFCSLVFEISFKKQIQDGRQCKVFNFLYFITEFPRPF